LMKRTINRRRAFFEEESRLCLDGRYYLNLIARSLLG
jgi:hypothetical protein